MALLGLLALTAVPETQATDVQAETRAAAERLPIEVTVVREVEQINAGRFDFGAGESDSNDALVLSPVQATTLSQFDPNL